MKTPCKHGHVDGVMHTPCPDCRVEHLEALVEIYRDTLAQIAEGGRRVNWKRLARAALAFGETQADCKRAKRWKWVPKK